ncbi:MAG TPA: hypothetical protein VFP77_01080 [Gemmatimonadaceae bacterium]|jgi:hypothetical protein|nr:hypothetical protein [Gemmatimonadaceae bacterium]
MRDRIADLTGSLRGSDEKLFPRLRQMLSERGIDPETSVLVEMFSDEREFEYGIVVTERRDVYQFGLDCMGRAPDAAELIEWVDWTKTYHLAAFRRHVEAAMELLPLR